MRAALSTKTALFGGVLAGIGASACCIGPLVLLSLGIGGAWIAHLTALEPFRPVFMALTALFLFLAFRRLYYKPHLESQTCIADETCNPDRARTVQRTLFWILAPVTLALVASPWFLPLFYQ